MSSQVVLITGASRGIGRAVALRFAEAGYRVALTARNQALLEQVVELCRQQGADDVLAVRADLRKGEDIRRLARTVLETWGQVDVLVNNAGVMHNRPFLQLTEAEMEEMLDVNFKAVYRLIREVLPSMIEHRSGVLVNIASLAAKNFVKNNSGYVATKFALRGFANSLMLEVREHGIRVVTVFPGSVDTDLITRSPTAPLPEYMLQPEDVAHAVFAAVSVHPRAMISEIDIRPSNPKRA